MIAWYVGFLYSREQKDTHKSEITDVSGMKTLANAQYEDGYTNSNRRKHTDDLK